MPTTRPRYTLTDTGDVADLLDVAAKAWPEVEDRRELLRRVLAAGRSAVEAQATQAARQRALQRSALASGNDGLDVELLLSNAAWR